MDKNIRETQWEILKTFGQAARTFALAGGTALELFYLKHRFSRDLDFFSPKYDLKEIDNLISKFGEAIEEPIRFENEFVTPDHAKVRFYVIKIKGTDLPLKIDFVEDVFFDRPSIKKFDNIPVYDVRDIYFQKIMALVGTRLMMDETGREITTGRRAVRDIVDVYYLSKKFEALHEFMKKLNRQYQRGIIQWHRNYSRHETKLDALDLEIYDKNFDVSEMIRYLDDEMKKFMHEVMG
jgi:predicted nucleotidyltransferase component of viral defense system